MTNRARDSFIDRALKALHPVSRIVRSDLNVLWSMQEFKAFSKSASALLVFLCIGYIAHYYFVDLPTNKQPAEWWMFYRFGLASLSLLTAVVIMAVRAKPGALLACKFMLFFVGLLCTAGQTHATKLYPNTPFYFSIVIPLFFVLAARSSLFVSTISFMAMCSLPITQLEFSGYNALVVPSFTFVSYVVLVAIRSSQSTEVDLFLANQSNLDQQREIIRFQTELGENIKAFLPKVLSEKLDEAVQSSKSSVAEVLDSILMPRETEVITVYSDIRRSVENTKKLKNYALNTVFPAQQHLCNLIEIANGIPRLTGDLVFAFFEVKKEEKTLENVIRMCLEMGAFSGSQEGLTRFFSISKGECVVGNLGGASGARDISVIGDAANLSARLDQLTKDLSGKIELSNGSIIIDGKFSKDLEDISLKFEKINLSDHQVSVRDFSEVTHVCVVPPSEENMKTIGKSERIADVLKISDFISQKSDLRNVA